MPNIYGEHRISDCHCDTLWQMDKPDYNFNQFNNRAHIDLPRLLTGGVRLLFFAVCTAPISRPGLHLFSALHYIRLYLRNLKSNQAHLLSIESKVDLEEAESGNKIACLLALEGAEPLEDCPDNLETFSKLGVRCLSLTWNNRNYFADGTGVGEAGGGLTRLGRRLIKKTSELGIILDLSHLSSRCFSEAMDLIELPPIVSHANSRHLCDHPRNLTDEQVRAVVNKNGVIGLSFNAPFISGQNYASLAQLLDHYVHLANIAGVSHLAIGSDYDGIEYPVDELPDASCYGRLIEGLYGRGFSSAEVDLIAGGNLRRLIRSNLHE